MDATMTPRDIQFKIRSGESLADVIAESGLPADRVEAFAAPILAEREHITNTALASPVRRRGETASARRLRQTVAEALLDRGQDIDYVTWDSWRRSDGRWIIQGTWRFEDQDRCARYIYDTRGRFSLADNDQARVLVGDLPLTQPVDTDSEPTIGLGSPVSQAQSSLADETTIGVPYEAVPEMMATTPVDNEDDHSEDSVRTDIDLLYDMISTIDEDSVRIFRGLRGPLSSPEHPSPQPVVEVEDSQPRLVDSASEPVPQAPPAADQTDTAQSATAQTEDSHHAEPKPHRRSKRASVPSWDDIIFGGRS